MKEDNQKILNVFGVNRKKGIQMLFERYYSSLVVYAKGKIEDGAMAEDIVQELFIRLWENDYLECIEASTLNSYLFSAVRNACYTYGVQKNVLRTRLSCEEVDIAVEVSETMNQEIVERVTGVIQKLPKQTQEVVNCILMYDMKYQETADKLGVSLNTVKTLLKSGMRFLREELGSERDLLLLFILWHTPGNA